jgi:hypothetical protein
MSNNLEESLFYKVPKRFVCQTEGCSSILTVFEVGEDSKEDGLNIQAQVKKNASQEERERHCVFVSFEKIFKFLEKEGIPVDLAEETLLSIRNRMDLVVRAVRNYISRNLIISNLD